jgi:hypothetical protein
VGKGWDSEIGPQPPKGHQPHQPPVFQPLLKALSPPPTEILKQGYISSPERK